MVCFFKRLDTFVTFGQADVTEFSVPLASSGGNTGSVTVVGELTQAFTRQWLIMQGRLWYTTEVNPDNGLTNITVADPLAAFGRTLVYSTPSTNILGEYIKAVAEAEYINLADTAYDMPYLTVTNSDTTTFTPVTPEDGLFSLENLMRDAQARGLFLTFDFDAEGLSLSITPGDATEYPVVVGDGHTQLISETYSQTAIAKVTVISDLGYPHDYYLSIEGTISTTPPVNRASGEWVTVKQGEDNLLDTATAVFAENIQSHKIEFYSDIPLDLYAHVNVRLNGKVYASQITYVGIMSRDSRFLYRCGELATTLTEKVASASSRYVTAEQAKGLAPVQSVNGQTGAVVLDASDVGALPDTYVAPVQSVNGQTGNVVLDASDVGALQDNQWLSIESSTSSTAVSVASATWTTVKSITLYPGRYLIVAGVNFASNSTGHRRVCISTGSDNNGAGYYCYDVRRAVDGAGTNSAVSRIVYVTTTAGTTFNLNVYQNSGSALTVNWGVECQRLD